jgi:predicted DNA-binding protein
MDIEQEQPMFGKPKTVTFWVTPELHKRLREIAYEKGVSQRTLIIEVIEKMVNEHGTKESSTKKRTQDGTQKRASKGARKQASK